MTMINDILAITIARGQLIERHRVGHNSVTSIAKHLSKECYIVSFDDGSYVIYNARDAFSVVYTGDEIGKSVKIVKEAVTDSVNVWYPIMRNNIGTTLIVVARDQIDKTLLLSDGYWYPVEALEYV